MTNITPERLARIKTNMIDDALLSVARHDALDLIAALEAAQAGNAKLRAIISPCDDTVDYVSRYGGRCRDCADENGICPHSGMPCDNDAKPIRHVLHALQYGIEHGFLPTTAPRAQP